MINFLCEFEYANPIALLLLSGSIDKKILEGLKGLNHIEMLLNKDFGIRNNILNWNELFAQVVENTYILLSTLLNEDQLNSEIETLLKYKEFFDVWNKVLKKKKHKLALSNIRLILNYPTVDNISLSIWGFPLLEDNIFSIEQIIPNTEEDFHKLQQIIVNSDMSI